jgi:hypothetical protein
MGVDTLTLWSTGPAGWRPADRALRAVYPPDVGISVQSPNSLRGAMPINGAAVVRELGRTYNQLKVTETHPKVLYFELSDEIYDYPGINNQMIEWLQQLMGLNLLEVESEHAWDALISAYVAKQWATKQWKADLHQLPGNPQEQLVSVYSDQAYYIWPRQIDYQDALPIEEGEDESKKQAKEKLPRWKVAVQMLEKMNHHDVAQEIENYRNNSGERSGWDSWFKSNHPTLSRAYENYSKETIM